MLKKRRWCVVFLWGLVMLFAGFSIVSAEDKKEEPESCVKPAKGPLGEVPSGNSAVSGSARPATISIARVGKPAPDFEASAYVDGRFKNVRLSDYKGQWVVLCFYPGDFTFV